MFKKFLNQFFPQYRREEGQGLIEYALILVLVAVVVIAILLILGPAIGNVFSKVTRVLQLGGNNNGAVTGVSASGGFGTVTVIVSVSSATTVSLSGSISGGGSCSPPSCTFSVSGPASGSVTATGSDGSQAADSWP